MNELLRRRYMGAQGGGSTPQWIIDASTEFGFPASNLLELYNVWPEVERVFVPDADGKWGYLYTDGNAYINTSIKPSASLDLKIRTTTYMSGSSTSYVVRYIGASQYSCCVGNSRWLPAVPASKYPVITEVRNGYLSIRDANNNSLTSASGFTITSLNENIWFGKINNLSEVREGWLNYFWSKGTGVFLIPYAVGNSLGMIDLMTNNIYYKAGSGTMRYVIA